MRTLFLALGLAFAVGSEALEIREFEDPAKQQAYERLIKDLRCLVCQNQSLADSDADLARDLRTEVYNIIQSGKSEQEAVKFLVDRYGDFVLYKPPLKPATLLLWLGPFVALLGGMAYLWRLADKRNRESRSDPSMTGEDRARLEEMKKRIEG